MKKIMFNDKYGLTHAVLDGRKTMTRRIVPQSVSNDYDAEDSNIINAATYNVGDVVAVAQDYGTVLKCTSACELVKVILITCDGVPGYHNKMFVRAGLMPHRIRITGIKVERLQNISEGDCLREGVYFDRDPFYYTFDGAKSKCGSQLHWGRPIEAFSVLIDKVSGKGTWAKNPLVFAYSFELVK